MIVSMGFLDIPNNGQFLDIHASTSWLRLRAVGGTRDQRKCRPAWAKGTAQTLDPMPVEWAKPASLIPMNPGTALGACALRASARSGASSVGTTPKLTTPSSVSGVGDVASRGSMNRTLCPARREDVVSRLKAPLDGSPLRILTIRLGACEPSVACAVSNDRSCIPHREKGEVKILVFRDARSAPTLYQANERLSRVGRRARYGKQHVALCPVVSFGSSLPRTRLWSMARIVVRRQSRR